MIRKLLLTAVLISATAVGAQAQEQRSLGFTTMDCIKLQPVFLEIGTYVMLGGDSDLVLDRTERGGNMVRNIVMSGVLAMARSYPIRVAPDQVNNRAALFENTAYRFCFDVVIGMSR